MRLQKVSILTRPFSSRGFHFVADRAFEGLQARFASDWRGVEPEWFMAPFYRTYRSRESTEAILAAQGVDEATTRDVVRRCRLLRAVPEAQARRMVASMWRAAEEFVDRHDADLIVSCHVDCYMYDVLSRVQGARGKAYVAIGDSLLPDYGEVNYRFHPIPVRDPADAEIAAVRERLQRRSFRPSYMVPAFYRNDFAYRFINLYLRHQARRVYFPLRRLVDRDPLNFHLNVVSGMACERIEYLHTWKYFHEDWRERLAVAGRPVVFVPLQFYPESRYDYSPLHPDLKDLPSLTVRLAELLSRDFTVAFKEHPAVYGSRDPAFYRTLGQFPNTVFVPPFVPVDDVTELSRCVITPGSTVGLETAVRGGRVVTIGRPPYFTPGAIDLIETPEDLAALPARLAAPAPAAFGAAGGRAEPGTTAGDDAPTAVVRTLLSQLLPGGCPYVKFDPTDEGAAREMARFAESLRTFLPLIHQRTLELNLSHAHVPARAAVPATPAA